MRSKHLFGVLVGFAAIAVLPADASAMYHPTLGRWMQRDPGPGDAVRIGAGGSVADGRFMPRDPAGQYVDGMSLYEYATSAPSFRRDPEGLAAEVQLQAKRLNTHGTAESYTTHSGENTFRVPDEFDDDKGASWLGKRLAKFTYPTTSEWAYISLDENTGSTWWWAALYMRVTRRSGWRTQISADYQWDLQVKNICCHSRRVTLRSQTRAPADTTVNVPAAGVYPIGEIGGIAVSIGTANLGGAHTHFGEEGVAATWEVSASAVVVVECEE